MKECFDACNDDDIPYIENGYNDIECKHQVTKKELISYARLGMSAQEIFLDKWQIKRAEPRVLSVDEAFMQDENQDMMEGDQNWMHGFETGYRTGFEDGDQNGQLREWLRPEHAQLRKAVEEYLSYTPCTNGFFWDMFHRAIENLKPPTEK
jgi:hypothetical protein